MFVNSMIHFMSDRTDKSTELLRTKDFNEKKEISFKIHIITFENVLLSTELFTSDPTTYSCNNN